MSTRESINYLYNDSKGEVLKCNPLGIRRVDLEVLAKANLNGDMQRIYEETVRVFRYVPDRSNLEPTLLNALIRDTGSYIGSCIKTGLSPNEIGQIPNFEVLCREAIRQGRSPYLTVYEYSILNPSDKRRSFTRSGIENEFIDATVTGVNAMVDCAKLLEQIRENEIEDPINNSLAISALIAFKSSGHAVASVMKNVGGELFARELRPYFDPLYFDGTYYDAPGGSQMPMVYVDHLLFGSDLTSQDLETHTRRNLKYLPQSLRQKIDSIVGQPSIITKMQNAGVALDGIVDIMSAVYGFRAAHLKLAKQSFGVREQNAVGSGGADPKLLEKIKDISYNQLIRAKQIGREASTQ